MTTEQQKAETRHGSPADLLYSGFWKGQPFQNPRSQQSAISFLVADGASCVRLSSLTHDAVGRRDKGGHDGAGHRCRRPHGRRKRERRRLSQSWQDFFLVESEEGFLLGSYLLHVDLVVAGLRCLPDVLPCGARGRVRRQ